MQVLTPIDLVQVRNRVSELLNHLGSRLTDTATDELLQSRVARLGQLAAGLAVVDTDCLPAEGAGYGSVVEVEDLETGAAGQYVLMVGSLVDIDANQVSLASPIGQALVGRAAGDVIDIQTPHKRTRLRVTRVVTLPELLQDYEI